MKEAGFDMNRIYMGVKEFYLNGNPSQDEFQNWLKQQTASFVTFINATSQKITPEQIESIRNRPKDDSLPPWDPTPENIGSLHVGQVSCRLNDQDPDQMETMSVSGMEVLADFEGRPLLRVLHFNITLDPFEINVEEEYSYEPPVCYPLADVLAVLGGFGCEIRKKS